MVSIPTGSPGKQADTARSFVLNCYFLALTHVAPKGRQLKLAPGGYPAAGLQVAKKLPPPLWRQMFSLASLVTLGKLDQPEASMHKLCNTSATVQYLFGHATSLHTQDTSDFPDTKDGNLPFGCHPVLAGALECLDVPPAYESSCHQAEQQIVPVHAMHFAEESSSHRRRNNARYCVCSRSLFSTIPALRKPLKLVQAAAVQSVLV